MNNPFDDINLAEEQNPFEDINLAEEVNPFDLPDTEVAPVKKHVNEDSPLNWFENNVPVVGHVVGVGEGLLKMTTQLMAQGYTDISGLTGATDEQFQQDVMANPLLQPSTDSGVYVQNLIGKVFEMYEEKSSEAIAGIRDSLVEANNPLARIADTALETARVGLPFALPYAPKAVRAGMKAKKANAEAKLQEQQANQQAADAGVRDAYGRASESADAAYRADPANPLEFRTGTGGDVRVPREGGDSLSYKEFSQLYKAENKKASTVETIKAWENYNSEGVRSAYTRLKDTTVFTAEGQRKVANERPGGVDPDVFLKQAGIGIEAPGIRDVGIMEYTPITMTRAEFAQSYGARIQKGLGPLARETKALSDQVKLLNTQLEQATGKMARSIAGDIKRINRKIDSNTAKVERIKQKMESPPIQSAITKAYNKYINNRIPWEQRIAHQEWRDKYTRGFELRESDAAALKIFQEESTWRAIEEQAGMPRGNLMATELTKAWEASLKEMKEVVMPPITRNSDAVSRSVASGLDDIINSFTKTADEIKKTYSRIDDSTPPPATLMRDNNHKTRTGIQQEFSSLWSDGMSYSTFAQNVRGKFPGISDAMIKSIHDKVSKTPVAPRTLKEKQRPVKESLQLSEKKRPAILTIGEVIAGKSISMLFQSAKYSPTLKELLAKIYRTEIHNMDAGKPNVITGYMAGRQMEYARYGAKLQAVYDTLQLNLGKGWFVGFKNLVPQKLNGWGNQSLPKNVNTMLFYALQGKPLRNTPFAILEASKQLRKLENEMFEYLNKSGVPVEYIENHLARMWKPDVIKANREAFDNMLSRRGYSKPQIDEIVLSITENGGMIEFPVRKGKIRGMSEADMRGQRLAKNVELTRKLQNLTIDDVMPFVETNVHKVMASYIDQATRRGEFAKRFGLNEEVMDAAIIKSQKELAEQGKSLTYQEVQRLKDLSEAMQGMYKVIDPRWNAMSRWPISLANFALLQFATIASLSEIALPVYQGGVKAYARAMPTAAKAMVKDFVRTNVYKGVSKTELQQFAEAINKAGELATAERVMGMYTPGWAALDAVTFKMNLLHSWTKFVNYVAVETYRNQVKNTLKNWSEGKTSMADKHNERLMDYYGMPKQEAIKWYKNGMQTNDPIFERFKNGAITFAEDSVLTSNPAIRPMWHSNPALSILAHLKGFPVMFGNTVLKRWWMDLAENNAGKYSNVRNATYIAGTGAAMTTIAMFSTILQDYLKFGEEGNPKYKDETQLELIVRGMDKVGLFGAGGSIVDAFKYGDYKGLADSVVGAPAIGVYEDAGNAVRGVLTWNSERIAKSLVPYTAPVIINLPRMGADITPDTKNELKDFYQYMLEDYLGMEPGGVLNYTE